MATRCGGCGALVPAGGSMQRLTLARVRRRLLRCEACVGSPGPPELGRSAGVTTSQLTARMAAIGQVAAQFPRPAPKPLAVTPRPRAYSGEPSTVQAKLLTTLPWYDR